MRVTPEAQEQFLALPRVIQVRVAVVFERLDHWPNVSGARPLRGPLAGHYRIRTGDYRVQFYVESGDAVVEKLGHRDGFYEE